MDPINKTDSSTNSNTNSGTSSNTDSNTNNGNEHHYTKSKSEKNWLVSLGWNDEVISKGESNYIVKNEGWKYEGISWYAAKLP